MSSIVRNTLKATIGKWQDPGDYPNGAASDSIPSFDYIESLEGEVWIDTKLGSIDYEGLHISEIDCLLEDSCPEGVVVEDWNLEGISINIFPEDERKEGTILIFTPSDWYYCR